MSLKRPFVSFVFLVVLPTAAAMATCVTISRRAWSDVHRRSHDRVAAIVLAAVDQELARAGSRALDVAAPVPNPDPSDPSVQRALSGDTVRGYRPTQAGVEVLVVVGGRDGGPVRVGSAAVDTLFASRLGRATGYATAVYGGGRRWAGSGPTAGGPALPDEVSLPGESTGAMDMAGGVFRYTADASASTAPAPPSALGALAVPRVQPPDVLARPVALVLGLLLLFSTLAAWIQLTRPPASRQVRTPSHVSFGVLALIPLLATIGLASHLDRRLRSQFDEAGRRDLTRALSAATVQGLTDSPHAVRQLTSFDATLTQRGSLVASTVESPPPALVDLPTPPPSFTSTGTFEVGDGEWIYAGMRHGEGGALVLTTPSERQRLKRFRTTAGLIAGLLVIWVTVVAVVGFKRPSARPQSPNS